jgi:ketosteroid isomerase-like protein
MGPSDTQVRGIWTQVSDGVREMAVISRDSGKTWKDWFDLLFRPRSRPVKDDAETVAALDEKFQAAVKVNDIATMQEILANDFVLVTGSGKTFSKPDLLEEARLRTSLYEHQEDSGRTVRVWGDTAIVTAKLWVKGTREGRPIDYTLWFSDTYVRTPWGWRHVFGQASLPLGNASRQTLLQ